jgi:chromosome segregation ATPase
MAESAITDLKVELEGIKQNLNTVDTITSRLDNAIVQLTTVATDVKSMLAVHEEKLHRAEKVDDLIFQKFRDKQDEMDKIYTDLKRDAEVQEQRIMNELKALHISVNRLKDDTAKVMDLNTSRISVLEQYKWFIMGGAIVIGWIISGNFEFLIKMMS